MPRLTVTSPADGHPCPAWFGERVIHAACGPIGFEVPVTVRARSDEKREEVELLLQRVRRLGYEVAEVTGE